MSDDHNNPNKQHDPDWPKHIYIDQEDGSAHRTRAYDATTGKQLDGVIEVDVEIDAATGKNRLKVTGLPGGVLPTGAQKTNPDAYKRREEATYPIRKLTVDAGEPESTTGENKPISHDL